MGVEKLPSLRHREIGFINWHVKVESIYILSNFLTDPASSSWPIFKIENKSNVCVCIYDVGMCVRMAHEYLNQ